jgi:hypothetical protein
MNHEQPLTIGLVAAGPLHAQFSTTGPTFPYPAGHEQSDGRAGQSDHISGSRFNRLARLKGARRRPFLPQHGPTDPPHRWGTRNASWSRWSVRSAVECFRVGALRDRCSEPQSHITPRGWGSAMGPPRLRRRAPTRHDVLVLADELASEMPDVEPHQRIERRATGEGSLTSISCHAGAPQGPPLWAGRQH